MADGLKKGKILLGYVKRKLFFKADIAYDREGTVEMVVGLESTERN